MSTSEREDTEALLCARIQEILDLPPEAGAKSTALMEVMESLAAERDALREQVARVEALADEWGSLTSRNARAFDYGRWHPAAAKQLRVALHSAPAKAGKDDWPSTYGRNSEYER